MRRVLRSGLSLVEMLVVLGVIGALAALIIPAVQSARQAAWRSACQNNLRQIGLALHQYQAACRVFPSPNYWTEVRQNHPVSRHKYSAFCELLPYIGEDSLYLAGDFHPYVADLANQGSLIGSINGTVAKRSIGVFLCPADSGRGMQGLGPVNYRFSLGRTPYYMKSPLRDYKDGTGAFTPFYNYSPGDFTDGLAYTAGMSERLIGSGKGWRHRGDFHYAKTEVYLDAEDLPAVCGNVTSGTPRFAQSGFSWLLGGYENTLYNHAAPPNFAVIDCTPEGSISNTNGGLFPPRSRHQGVNVMLMDGAVRLISDSIDFKTWQALATRAEGDAISAW